MFISLYSPISYKDSEIKGSRINFPKSFRLNHMCDVLVEPLLQTDQTFFVQFPIPCRLWDEGTRVVVRNPIFFGGGDCSLHAFRACHLGNARWERAVTSSRNNEQRYGYI